jgi:DNA adenine methylase
VGHVGIVKISVPPIKCQGIKTKLVPAIKRNVPNFSGRWIEPFCGSGVVVLNVLPEKALLCDTNRHIINFYSAIQSRKITPSSVRAYLEEEGSKLANNGESHYYAVRQRFNENNDPLDFLFLNRACFNGLIRFNRTGNFNVPFCRKPERFSPAYITKIVNQVRAFANIACNKDWEFRAQDFSRTLGETNNNDFIYADPPYAARHNDYYNSWTPEQEQSLTQQLKNTPCKFMLSTWQSNQFRTNENIAAWQHGNYWLQSFEHFYHIGSTEDLRHAMSEALVANFPLVALPTLAVELKQMSFELAG